MPPSSQSSKIFAQVVYNSILRASVASHSILSAAYVASGKGSCSDLLSAPADVSFPHVRWWLDGWHKFESGIGNSDNTDDGARDVVVPVFTCNDASKEDVDCCSLALVHAVENERTTYRLHGRGTRT
jgi:hypothetical protein